MSRSRAPSLTSSAAPSAPTIEDVKAFHLQNSIAAIPPNICYGVTGSALYNIAQQYHLEQRSTVNATLLGRTVTFDSFSSTLLNSHSVHITTEHFDVQLKNSDAFITLDWRAKVPFSTLRSHGLVGQTYTNDTFLSSSMHIEGEAEDYVEAYGNIFGHHFVYNRFLVQATSQQDDGK